MKNKLLIVSLHIGGGCFQYGNELFSRLKLPYSIFVPNDISESLKITNTHTLIFWKRSWAIRMISLFCFLIRIFFGGMTGHYSKLLIAGFSSWDYYILKVWRLTRKPSVFIVHDGIMHLGEASSKAQHQLNYLMTHATELIFLSEYVRQKVTVHLEISKPYHIVPHGLIDYGPLPETKKSAKPTLLFLGRVGQYKGVDILLKAMKMVPADLYDRVLIAGKWDIPYSDFNTDKIQIIDNWLDTDEILFYLSQADIMVFPYREATQSGVATLAIRYAIPSIVSDVGAFREQFLSESALFINEITPENLADAIITLCSDSQLCKKMHASLLAIQKSFDWDVIAASLDSYLSA